MPDTSKIVIEEKDFNFKDTYSREQIQSILQKLNSINSILEEVL